MAKGGRNKGEKRERLSEDDRQGLYKLEKERRRLERAERLSEKRTLWGGDEENDDDY